MISIGNDIVDLTAIDKNRTQQKAFYSKILSDTEQQLYSRSSQIPFEIYVWLLWSAKESVYKFAKRLDPDLVFSPPRIVTQSIFEPEFSKLKDFQNDTLEGTSFDSTYTIDLEILHKGKTYYTRSFIFNELIATFAGDEPTCVQVQWGIKKIESADSDFQSQAVRHFFLDRLNPTFAGKELKITKTEVGYPIFSQGDEILDIKASFAHHGQYVAYAFGSF
jgi:phosphopantetheinyl transferase (holo-ACP synthase)